MNNIIRLLSACGLLLLLPSTVWGDPSLGDVADSLMTPTEIITKLTVVASYIVGVGLLIFAIAQYKQHRQSPKLVPLTTPIMLVILGVCALLIPYVSIISGKSYSAVEQAKREGKLPPKSGALSPDLPTVEGKKRLGPGRYAPEESRADPTGEDDVYDDEYDDVGDDDYDDNTGGHWTSDPRYR